MTRDEARVALEAGEDVRYDSWSWNRYSYTCGNYDDNYGLCCYETFGSVQESLEHLEMMCGGKWEDVK